jgi:hypothetical protein
LLWMANVCWCVRIAICMRSVRIERQGMGWVLICSVC